MTTDRLSNASTALAEPVAGARWGTGLTLRGSTVATAGRRPRAMSPGRVCQHSDCATVLSRYNLDDSCTIHKPIRFPRVRGAALEAPGTDLS